MMVCDLDAERVSSVRAKSAKGTMQVPEVMSSRDFVITFLPSSAASNAVICEMLPYITEGKIWMEMSTTDEAEVKRLGAKVIAVGGLAVDCPVSGGCQRVTTGNISILARCDRDTFDRLLPLSTKMGRRIMHTGALGSVSVLKVITNYLVRANLISCTEVLAVAKASSMDLATDCEAI